MKKVIVTHHNPDLDAATCVWLLKRFRNGFEEAEVKFCDAGNTYHGIRADSDDNIVHVDTGGGRFDHHPSVKASPPEVGRHQNEHTCSAKLVLDALRLKDDALQMLVEVVTEVDNGEMLYKWCDPASARYEFCLPNILWGIKSLNPGEDEKPLNFVLENLDVVYFTLKKKVLAKNILRESGTEFETPWGLAVACETVEGSVDWEGRLLGYALIVRCNPRSGAISIKGRKDHGVDLTKVYEGIKRVDSEGDWFLHASKVLLINSSGKNRSMRPTRLSLDEVVGIIKGLDS